MIIPVLALLNIFLSHLHRGMECTLSKHTGQTNRVSMCKATAFLCGVSEAIVSSFTSYRREMRSKKWCELSRGLQRWLRLETLPAKWGCKNGACPAWNSKPHSNLTGPLEDYSKDGSLQRCTVKGWEATDTSSNKGILAWLGGWKTIPLWTQLSNEERSSFHRDCQI